MCITIDGVIGIRDFKIKVFNESIKNVEYEFEVEVGAKVEKLQTKGKLQ